MLLGLEVVAAGKSSEYDFVWDRESGDFQYLDGNCQPENLPQMLDCWYYKGTETLEERRKLLEKYLEVIPADLCEMNLVSNVSGLVPTSPFLSYPIAKISELANIFIPKGTVFTVHGHHHQIDGLTPELLERKAVGNAAPFYLLNGSVLLKDVKKGDPVTMDDVDLSGLETYQLYKKGLELG